MLVPFRVDTIVSYFVARTDNIVGTVFRKVLGGPILGVFTAVTGSFTRAVDGAVTSVKKGIQKKVSPLVE